MKFNLSSVLKKIIYVEYEYEVNFMLNKKAAPVLKRFIIINLLKNFS